MNNIKITKTINIETDDNTLFLIDNVDILLNFNLKDSEIRYIKNKIKDEKYLVNINYLTKQYLICYSKGDNYSELNNIRKLGLDVFKTLKYEKADSLAIVNLVDNKEILKALITGIILSSYEFNSLKTKNKDYNLSEIKIASENITVDEINEVSNLANSVNKARDLVNMPNSHQTANSLSQEVEKIGLECGFKTTIFNKAKLESLKFGGLLAVNKGSIEPPTFTIMEWNPNNAINKKPFIVIGKGVVFDTGGVNLKTIPGSIDTMKGDMGGAASVIGVLMAVSKNKLPLHVIGMIPATDNRPGQNAIVPGDVITMHNGTTVEVLNTDAEGRLILADALSYANKYEPELVFDLATLTGSAAMAIGPYASIIMGTADDKVFSNLETSGYRMHDRVVRFPFWNDFDELIKSDNADITNLGPRHAGAITAGKFLSNFTDYPWVHIDIAGPSFLEKPMDYFGKGATGAGIRLLYDFFRNYFKKH